MMLIWLICGLVGYGLLVWVRYWQDSDLALISFLEKEDYNALWPGFIFSLILGPLTIIWALYARFFEGK